LTLAAAISKIGIIGKTIMSQPLISRLCIALAAAWAVILPIAICLFLAIASLLSAMGDSSGAYALRWVGLICGILWVLDLILLVIALAVNVLSEKDDSDTHET
jgi:hypothetical protein